MTWGLGSWIYLCVDRGDTRLLQVGACSGFFSLGWALIDCQLFSGVLLGVSMLPEPIGSAHIVVVWLWQMNCT